MDATVPEIVLDYYFMGEESETAPHIVVKDRKSNAYFSTSLDFKTSQYAVAFVAGAIQELGYNRSLLKSDNEPAIKRLKESFGMFTRCGVCAQRGACRRQSCKRFGKKSLGIQANKQDFASILQRYLSSVEVLRVLNCPFHLFHCIVQT